jgi:hypothetical protein
VPADAVVRALAAWTQLFGFISFELFGHLVDVVEDCDAIFDQAVTDIGAFVGLARTSPLGPGRRAGGGRTSVAATDSGNSVADP